VNDNVYVDSEEIVFVSRKPLQTKQIATKGEKYVAKR